MKARAASEPFFRPLPEIYQDCYEGRQFHAIYFAMLIFACLIALFGLLLNSPAVIIGAMLISPLMGPILSCGLALTIADWDFGGKAVRNLLYSLIEVVVIAALATFLSPLKEATAEILARTHPNLMDLLVALFSGFAGTLALASRSRGALTIIPGVAIATAVMPPLATIGFGLAAGQWNISAGALMLFLTNLGAIVLSAAIVFVIIGFRPHRREGAVHYRLAVRITVAALVLVALSVPLVRTLVRAAQQTQLRRDVANALISEFSGSDRKLDDFTVYEDHGRISVDASVHTAAYIKPDEVTRYEKDLATRIRRKVHLNLLQLQIATERPSETVAQRDYLRGGVRKAPPVLSPVEATAKVQQDVQGILSQVLANSSVTAVQVNSVAMGTNGHFQAELLAYTRNLTDSDLWNVAAAALAQKLNTAVELKVIAKLNGTEVPIDYVGKAISPPLPARLQAVALIRSNKKLSLEYELLGLPGELTGKRVNWLNRYLNIKATAAVPTVEGVSDNQIVLRAVQQISGAAAAPQLTQSTE